MHSQSTTLIEEEKRHQILIIQMPLRKKLIITGVTLLLLFKYKIIEVMEESGNISVLRSQYPTLTS